MQTIVKLNKTQGVINVVPPKTGTIHPRIITALFDISGSMNAAGNPNGKDGVQELSKFDLAKYAIKALVKGLSATDKFALITFGSDAAVFIDPIEMTDANKNTVFLQIDQLYPIGCTNMWRALELAFDLANRQEDSTILLITDGQPSNDMVPWKGFIPSLNAYYDADDNKVKTRIHTIGIGMDQDIDSTFLHKISQKTGGIFSYVSDGTGIIPTIATTLGHEKCTIAKDTKVTISGANIDDLDIIGAFNSYKINDTTFVVEVGKIMYGQTRSFALKIKSDSTLETIGKLTFNTTYKMTDNSHIENEILTYYDTDITKEMAHFDALNIIKKAYELGLNNKIQDASDYLVDRTYILKQKIPNLKIYEDIDGEVKSAFATREYFNRWGKNYVLSIIEAHTNSVVYGNMNPGTLQYGGDTYEKIITHIFDQASKLDPIVGSLRRTDNTNYGTYANTGRTASVDPQIFTQIYTSPVVDRTAYAQSGGCFAGDGLVTMNDGYSLKKISELVSGDILEGGATVECLVAFRNCETIEYVDGNNKLNVTKWHPVIRNGEWVHPLVHTPVPVITMRDKVYTLVLDKQHTIHINNILACTLGHGFSGQIIEHQFYGTHKVILDLIKFSDYSKGYIELGHENMKFDDGEIIGYKV